MSRFAPQLNSPPMDPTDDRFFFGVDFTPVITDGGTIGSPAVEVDQAGINLGVEINDVTLDGLKVLFRPSVAAAKQSDPAFGGSGRRFLITITVQSVAGRKIQRSVWLTIAQR